MDKKTSFLALIIAITIIIYFGFLHPADPTKDIVPVSIPEGSWNGPPGEWIVNGTVVSASNSHYSQAQIQLTAYDGQNNVVGAKNTTIYNITGIGYYQTIIKVTNKPDHINITVLNATKV